MGVYLIPTLSGGIVPKINVYLPDDLAEAVKDAGIPVSPLCQHVLQLAVRSVNSVREAVHGDIAATTDVTSRLLRYTDRARDAVGRAVDTARDSGAPAVDSGHLLGGLIAEGNNLALLILRSLEIEPAAVSQALARSELTEAHAETWRFSEPAANALQASLAESFALGHNYIGCEHLLLGLVAEPDGVAGRVLRDLGADQRITRRSVSAALSGFVHARTQVFGPAVATSTPTAAADMAALRTALQAITQRLERVEADLAALST